jgi:hypothetical protein
MNMLEYFLPYLDKLYPNVHSFLYVSFLFAFFIKCLLDLVEPFVIRSLCSCNIGLHENLLYCYK